MRTKQQNFFLILMLGLLNALTPFSIDMYLPAFPEITRELQTTIEKVSLSVSTYFIGFAIGQIFYGPFLDRFGRKLPLYVGLTIYLIASIGCMMAKSVEILLLFRFLQALGGSASSVGATAMVLDFFPSKDSAKVFSLLMLVLSASPLLAPSIGSLIVVHAGWRVVFGALTILGVLNLLMLYFFVPEGHTPDRMVSLQIRPILKIFYSILKEPHFFTYTLAGSFSFAGLFVYVAGSPAIFMDGFHLSASAYGAVFALLAMGMIGGGQLNLLFTKKFSNKTVFQTALLIQVIVGAFFFVGTLRGLFGLESTIAFLFLMLACAGITYPNAASIALAPFAKNAGSASALLGFLQLSVGALASVGVGLLSIKGSLPTAAVMSLSATIGLAILAFAKVTIDDFH